MKRPATMRDVAAAARVSQRTVSNVVNDYRHVSSGTRDRVLSAIAELGYRPNVAAQSLRAGKTGIIALAVPKLSWPYFGQIAHRIQVEAAGRGYTLVVAETEGSRAVEKRVLRHFNANLVDGIIFSPIEAVAADMDQQRVTVPLVLIGESVRNSALPHFEINSIQAGQEVARHLVAQGAQSFLVVGSTTSTMTSGPGPLRQAGFRQGLEESGISERAWQNVVAPWTYKGAHKAVSEYLQTQGTASIPDALIAMNDIVAAGAIRALADRGITVPRDMLVSGWDNTPESAYLVPSLTTISPDKRSIAQKSVRALTSMIEGNQSRPTDGHIGYELLVRESTTPPR